MTTMYEIIQDLPLLKGITDEQVSAFLEKTHVHFLKFKKGDRIISKGERCEFIRFLISGSVSISRSNTQGNLAVVSEVPAPGVLLPEYLFGMRRDYPVDVTALEAVSIMEFSKEQYFALLQSDMIYMLNFLNYLSLHAQKAEEATELPSGGSLCEFMATWVMALTESDSKQVEIIATRDSLRKLTNLSDRVIDLSLNDLKKRELIEYSRRKIIVKSREALIEAGREAATAE